MAFHHCLRRTPGIVLSAAAGGFRQSEEAGGLLRHIVGRSPYCGVVEYQPDAVGQSARYRAGWTATAVVVRGQYFPGD